MSIGRGRFHIVVKAAATIPNRRARYNLTYDFLITGYFMRKVAE